MYSIALKYFYMYIFTSSHLQRGDGISRTHYLCTYVLQEEALETAEVDPSESGREREKHLQQGNTPYS